MDCRKVRELADSFLSEQLLVETNHEVLRHLESCNACRAELDARHAIRERLRGAFASSAELSARPDFAEELTRKLRASLNRPADPSREHGFAGRREPTAPPASPLAQPAPSHPVPAATSRRTLLRTWWTAAAGVLLAAGGGVAVRQMRSRARLTTLAMKAAADHQNCAIRFNLSERPIALDEAGRRYGMPFTRMASFALPSLDAAAEPLDRHSCIYDNQRFAHIVVRYRGAVTSLLVTEGSGPSQPQIESTSGAPVVASLSAGDFVAFVVADLGSDEVLRLARAIEPALGRHLSA